MSTPRTPSLNSFRMKFDGALLQRGFWIYVWKVCQGVDTYVYVGRTGDSSSPNAGSPFNRIGQHLDFRANAKGNSLSKRLGEKGIVPAKCSFEMVAIGPLFPEADSMEAHRPVRDQVGAVENGLAKLLRERGYTVLGKHGSASKVDDSIMERVVESIDRDFPHV